MAADEEDSQKSAFEVIEDTVRRMIEHDRKEQVLARKKAAWGWLIEQHESEHTTQ